MKAFCKLQNTIVNTPNFSPVNSAKFRATDSVIYLQFRTLLHEQVSQTYFLTLFTFFRTDNNHSHMKLKSVNQPRKLEVIVCDKRLTDFFASQKCITIVKDTVKVFDDFQNK